MTRPRRLRNEAVQSPLETYLREINETRLLNADGSFHEHIQQVTVRFSSRFRCLPIEVALARGHGQTSLDDLAPAPASPTEAARGSLAGAGEVAGDV